MSRKEINVEHENSTPMKKFLSFLLCTLLCALCSTVSAATDYGIKVGGVSVTSDNASNVTGSNIKAYNTTLPYSVVYNASTKTLTLDNIRIERTGSYNRAILNDGCDGLTVIFKSQCYLKAADSSPLRFNANTTLKSKNGYQSDTTYVYGVDEDAITVGSGATLTIDGACLHVEASNSSAIIGNSSTRAESLYIKNSNFYIHTDRVQWFGAIYNFHYVYFSNSQGKAVQTNFKDSFNASFRSISHNDKVEMANDMKFLKPAGGYFNSEGSYTCIYSNDDELGTRMKGIEFERALLPVDAAHFPDANFRSFLLEQEYIVTGHLFASDIPKATKMNIEGREITSLKGIEYFTSLLYLYCHDNQLTTLDLSKNTALKNLYAYNNQLTTLDLSKNTALASLYAYNNRLTTLDLSKNTSLAQIDVYNNQLTTLNVKNCVLLERLICYQNNLTTLDVSGKYNMTYLKCQHNALTSLNLSGCTALKSLTCDNNKLKTIDVSSAGKSLTDLTVNANKLTSLDVTANTELKTLYCYDNQLTTLNVSQNKQLVDLSCYENKLSALNLMYNGNLTKLNCYANQITGEAMTELVSGLPPQSSAKEFDIVNHDSPAEGNEITSEQVEIAKKRGWIPFHYYNGWQPTVSCRFYDLWIKGLHVHSHGPVVTGVIYEAATKTLTLNNANITYDGTIAILSKIDNLNVKLIGKNVINTPGSSLGMRLMANTAGSKVTFLGGGELSITSGGIALQTYADVEFKDGVKVSAESTETLNGMQGRKFTADGNFPTIIMSGEGTEVKAKGGTQGSVLNFHALNFSDGIAIAEPTGATFAEDYGVVKDNRIVAGEWVVFKKAGINYDLNGDGKVSTADIQIIINEMKKAQASQNMSYDLNGDGKISTADIQVIINEMKK